MPNELHQQAKKDYATGTYGWFDLQRKYPSLTINQIFAIIFEVKKDDVVCKSKNQYEKLDN